MKQSKFSPESLLQKDFKIVENMKKYFLVFGIVLLIAVILSLIPVRQIGLNLSVEYTGGYQVEIATTYDLSDKEEFSELKNSVKKVFSGLKNEDGKSYNLAVERVQYVGEDASCSMIVVYKSVGNANYMEEVNEVLVAALKTNLEKTDAVYDVLVKDAQSYSATTERLNILLTLVASLAVLVVILSYVFIRYDLKVALATIISSVHDLLMTLAFVAICHIELTSAVVATLFALAAFSALSSMGVYERIRENLKKLKGQNKGDAYVANLSVKENAMRAIYTALVLTVALEVLLAVGAGALKGIAVTLIIGVLSSIYSSNCITTSVWTRLRACKKEAK